MEVLIGSILGGFLVSSVGFWYLYLRDGQREKLVRKMAPGLDDAAIGRIADKFKI